MPNYCNTTTEKLMTELTNKLSSNQNDLFSELLEGSCAIGKSTENLIKEYSEFMGLSKGEIKETFQVLVKVLVEQEKESVRNFEE